MKRARPDKSHQRAFAASGLRMSQLIAKTGMTDEGLRKCLRSNRPPTNPIVRRAYLEALGIADVSKVGAP